jgi:hypothetical protein
MISFPRVKANAQNSRIPLNPRPTQSFIKVCCFTGAYFGIMTNILTSSDVRSNKKSIKFIIVFTIKDYNIQMASRITLMSALFDQFTSFVSELSEMYPDDPDFSMFLTTIRLMRSTNPSLVVSNLYDATHPYEEQIIAKDERFFLENDFDEHKESVDMDIMNKLKQYVSQMSESSKENVWKYCQNITRLSKACYQSHTSPKA